MKNAEHERRRKREQKRKEREQIMKDLHIGFLLNASGWDVDHFLRECGRRLVPDERFNYMPDGMNFEDLDYYLRIAKRHDVPTRVYKDRLRLGHDPLQAATTPYNKKTKRKTTGGAKG